MPTELFHRILVAVDFSSHADETIQRAIWVARKSGGSITVAHVVTDIRSAILATSYEARKEYFEGASEKFEKELRKNSDIQLVRLTEKYKNEGVAITCETMLGTAFVEVIHAVQQGGFDLVITGTREKAKLDHFLHGSTANRLIRMAPAPVWVIKHHHGWPIKSILVPIDFSEVSGRALEHAAWLAGKANATVHLLHVIDSSEMAAQFVKEAARAVEPPSAIEDLKNAVNERLSRFQESQLSDPLDASVRVVAGDPWREITTVAEENAIDLVVMGTVGRSGIKGLLMGSTAERVLSRLDCGILTVKPEGFVSPIDPPF